MRLKTEAPSYGSWWRPLGVFGLLVGEYLYLALRFDGLMHRYPGPWQNLADIVTFSVLGLAGVLALAGRKTATALREELAHRPQSPRLPVPLSVHLVSYGALVLWASYMTSRSWEPAAFLVPVLLFCALALLSLAGALLCLLDGPTIVRIATRLRGTLVLGFAGGVGGYLAGLLASFLWKSLSGTTIRLVAHLLMFLGAEVEVDYAADLVFTEGFTVQVGRQCSGLEGMGLIALFLVMYLWIERARLRFPRALIVLPVGVLAMYLVNLVRIAVLILVGARISPAIATGGFHSKAGWVYFCGLAVLFMFYLSRAKLFLRESPADEGATRNQSDNPAAAYLLPLLILIGTALLTGSLNETEFDLFYGVRVLTVAAVCFRFRAKIAPLLAGMSLYGLASGVLCFGLWLWLAPTPAGEHHQQALDSLNRLPSAGRWLWLAARVAGAILVVPLAEELAFRGFLLRRFVSADFEAVPQNRITWLGLLASSLVFGALHSAAVAATVVGTVYALTMWRRGAIGDAILAHAVTNLLLSGYVLWSGQWGYW